MQGTFDIAEDPMVEANGHLAEAQNRRWDPLYAFLHFGCATENQRCRKGHRHSTGREMTFWDLNSGSVEMS